MVNVNLLPSKKKKMASGSWLYTTLACLWLVSASYFGALYYLNKKEVVSLQEDIKKQSAAVANTEKALKAEQSKVTVNGYVDLSTKLQHLFIPATTVMDEIAHSLPKDGKLTGITYNLEGNISLQGSFERYEEIASYIHNLERIPYVAKVLIKEINTSETKYDPGTEKEWDGPVDEDGEPVPYAVEMVGGEMLPRYEAKIEVIAVMFDEQKEKVKK